MLEKLDKTLQRFCSSGGHSETSENKDLDELIKKVAALNPFSEIELSSKYAHFFDFKHDRLEYLDVSDLYHWINRHKQNVVMGIGAREKLRNITPAAHLIYIVFKNKTTNEQSKLM